MLKLHILNWRDTWELDIWQEIDETITDLKSVLVSNLRTAHDQLTHFHVVSHPDIAHHVSNSQSELIIAFELDIPETEWSFEILEHIAHKCINQNRWFDLNDFNWYYRNNINHQLRHEFIRRRGTNKETKINKDFLFYNRSFPDLFWYVITRPVEKNEISKVRYRFQKTTQSNISRGRKKLLTVLNAQNMSFEEF